MNIAIFASGNGGNFQAIVEAINQGFVEANISFLFCDQKNATVIQRAGHLNIPVRMLSLGDYPSKVAYEEALLNFLEKEHVELIVLAGYMKIIGQTLLDAYPKRIINIHPSLLPSFPGCQGIKDAFDAKVEETGVTIHFVDAGIDTGPVIAQEKISINFQETLESLEKKIHNKEHSLYPTILDQLIKQIKRGEYPVVKKRALLSVSDKTGIVEFAKGLIKQEIEIISTGGTKKILDQAGIQTIPVDEVTGFPEMMDGRVKTLHPFIHGGLLAKRDEMTHVDAMKQHNIVPIDIVCVNLYPFKETIMKTDCTMEQAIENIDIGGPSMLRSAAKNHQSVTVIVDPKDYSSVLDEWQKNNNTSFDTRQKLAAKTFRHTAAYDALIAEYMTNLVDVPLPETITASYELKQTLRYGENNHQEAAFYQNILPVPFSIACAKQLHGKELSYNNIRDADAAIRIVREFEEPAVVAVKHMNPCGIGIGKNSDLAYQHAYEADTVSIFGGVVVFNREIEKQTAEKMHDLFLEIIIAPSFTQESLDILSQKKNLRLLTLDFTQKDLAIEKEKVSVLGGVLIQNQDLLIEDEKNWRVVTKKQPTPEELLALKFAFKAVKHVKSNAIVVANQYQTLGIGAGQMNRIGAVEIAIKQAGSLAQNAILASDAFFPMSDSVAYAGKNGIKAIIQPGGSIKDQDSIDLADALGITMIFTGTRHFRH